MGQVCGVPAFVFCNRESPIAHCFGNGTVQGVATRGEYSVDWEHYTGLWHEHSRIMNWFEDGASLAAATARTPLYGATAEYQLIDGKLQITNRLYDQEGFLVSEAEAVGVPYDSRSFTVSFDNACAVARGFYRVYAVFRLGRSQEYDVAIVGDREKNYGWVLTRTPTIPIEWESRIDMELNMLGFPSGRFMRSPPVMLSPDFMDDSSDSDSDDGSL